MKIIDISREIFTSPCYADDPQPHYRWHKSLYAGDEFNLSVLSMTPHAGTHIDAPVHFIKHGKSVEECSLEKCFGPCTVITISGVLTGEDMDRLLPHCAKRLLIHGSGDAVLELSEGQRILVADPLRDLLHGKLRAGEKLLPPVHAVLHQVFLGRDPYLPGEDLGQVAPVDPDVFRDVIDPDLCVIQLDKIDRVADIDVRRVVVPSAGDLLLL